MKLQKNLLVLLVISFLPMHAFTDILDDFPETERFRVATGATVLLPLQLNSYKQLTLLGSADLESVNMMIANEDLIAIPQSYAPDRVSVAIFFINYLETSIGAYQEIITAIEVEEAPLPGAEPARGYYVLDIQVTNRFSRRVGRDVWGLPKTLANISLQENGEGDLIANVANRFSSASTVAALCSGCAYLPQFPDAQNFLAVSPYKLRRTWYRIMTEAQASFRPYDAMEDQFTLNTNSKLGRKLTNIYFSPEAWLVGHEVKGLTFKSNAPLTPY
ncbi:MAG: acetoacetate decarboxylase family protein [Cellvibrionaceae bacterium]